MSLPPVDLEACLGNKMVSVAAVRNKYAPARTKFRMTNV